jgi:hypothetical protein
MEIMLLAKIICCLQHNQKNVNVFDNPTFQIIYTCNTKEMQIYTNMDIMYMVYEHEGLERNIQYRAKPEAACTNWHAECMKVLVMADRTTAN